MELSRLSNGRAHVTKKGASCLAMMVGVNEHNVLFKQKLARIPRNNIVRLFPPFLEKKYVTSTRRQRN